MRAFILHIYDFLCARRRVAALLLIAVLLLSALGALRLHFQEDISAFLPQEQREQLQNAQGQETQALFFRGGTIDGKLDAMDAFATAWNERFPDSPVQSQASGPGVQEVFGFLSGNWPYFLEEADYTRMDSLLALPGYVTARMHQNKMALYGANAIQQQYMRSDPLALYSPVLGRFRDAMPQTRLEDGWLFTPDGETGILFLSSPYGGSETADNTLWMAQVNAVKEEVMQAHPEVSVFSTGGPEVAVGNAARIKKDSLLALAIAAILICVVLWFSYKRLADVLWILIAIGTGALVALGIIGLFKSSVSLIVLGIGCTIIGIAVNYPLHYVDHLKYQPNKRQALAEQVNPLLVGNITTVGAFLSLLVMKSEALQDFGFIGAAMLVGTILFVLVFLPVFVPEAKAPRKAIKLDFDRHIQAGPRAQKAFFCAFLLLTGLLWWQSGKVGFDANLHHINYMTASQEEGFAILESLQPREGAFPLPSLEQQQERLARWDAFWKARPELSAAVIDAGLQEGFTAHAFQPFFDALDKEWQPQEASYFQTVCFTPQAGVGSALVQSLQQDFDTIGLLCSLIVFLFLWASFGSLELSILSFLPLAVSWIWIQGIMGLAGLQFNIVNIILATFIFGQGDDYTIFITEGLLYERATGKKILHSYKNAVVLSALIMFIGIGALVMARHPAMRSLGLVTVIGMITVVCMAYYLPPLVFRWLTTKHGEPRQTPLTLGGLAKTVFIGLVYVLSMVVTSAWAFLYFLVGPTTEKKQERFHRVLQWMSVMALRILPGCPFKLHNPHGEDFSAPAVYVCNHQSHLDVLAILSLNPKVIFTTNNRVWNFPLYGYLLRKAEFFPASGGQLIHLSQVQELLRRGYSLVIFPEGTRSEDGCIQRFHRGAFLTARELGLDVLPLCIHGFHEALPKHSFLLRKSALSLEVGKRISVPEKADIKEFTRSMRHFYQDWYAQVRVQRETASFNAPIVKAAYLYKGHDAQAECRRTLRKEVFAQIAALPSGSLDLPQAGCGVYALLVALSRPDIQVTGYIDNEEQYLTAVRCAALPSNLKYVKNENS